MTGNVGDSIIICVINFEKYSLKRLYECITRAYMREMLYDNPVQIEILTQMSRKFPANNVPNLSKSIFATYGAQVADLPLTGT